MRDSKALGSLDLSSNIQNRLKGRAAIVGIGNPLKGDDAFGPRLIEALKKSRVNVSLFDCGTAPENYIFPILSSSCDTVILVDSGDIGLKPGEMKVLDLSEVSRTSFSTHNPSPRLFTDLLKTGKEDLNIFVVSIQPKTTKLGASLSEEVHAGLDKLAEIFAKTFA